jgi:hypothetical protein
VVPVAPEAPGRGRGQAARGNTVFFRREFLTALRRRYGAAWDESCLTEDAKIGITASVLGCKVDVVYLDELVTREETPPSLAALARQRVRWMQGFIQVFTEGEWLRLPTFTQRVLAVYVLGFQFFQSFAGVLAPLALLLAVLHKSAVLLTLLATIPLGIGVLNVLLDVVLLAQFGRTFGEKVRLRDYAGLILGAYPFQVVLSLAAVWALLRFALNRGNWVRPRTTAPTCRRHGQGGCGRRPWRRARDHRRDPGPRRQTRWVLAPAQGIRGHGGPVQAARREHRHPRAGPRRGRRRPRGRDGDLPEVGGRPGHLPVAGLVVPVRARAVAVLLHLRPRPGGLDPGRAVVDADQRVQPVQHRDRVSETSACCSPSSPAPRSCTCSAAGWASAGPPRPPPCCCSASARWS